MVETHRANLVVGMKWLLGTYNRRHRYFGHLISGSYKALLVRGACTSYLTRSTESAAGAPLDKTRLGPEV